MNRPCRSWDTVMIVNEIRSNPSAWRRSQDFSYDLSCVDSACMTHKDDRQQGEGEGRRQYINVTR